MGCIWVQISSQCMIMEEEKRGDYNDFSQRMSNSLSKRWVCMLLKTYLGFFSLNGLLNTFVGNEDIYSMSER